MMRGMSDAMLGVSKRERMARRADKWWRSVWHVQMCMGERGIGLDVGPKTLTDDVGRGFLKAQSKHKPYVGRSDRYRRRSAWTT